MNEVTRERAQSFLTIKQQERILKSFRAFATEEGFSAVATLDQIAANGANLSIPVYVKKATTTISGIGTNQPTTLPEAWTRWQTDGREFWQQMDVLVKTLDGLALHNDEKRLPNET